MIEIGKRPYKQVARAQASERTKEALIDAANDELLEGGWSKASLDSLAAKAGVTKQTALRHFGSKEGLIDAAIRRLSEIVRRERAQAPVGDVRGAVRNLVEHYERWGDMVLRVLAEEHRSRLVHKMTDRGREVHREWVTRTFEPQLAALHGQARERRTAQLVAVCDVQVWRLLRRDMKLDAEQTEIALVELLEALVADAGAAGSTERTARPAANWQERPPASRQERPPASRQERPPANRQERPPANRQERA